MSPSPKRQQSPSPLSGTRRWFAAVCVLLPFLVLLLLEGGLRWAGFGGYPPLLLEIGETSRGTLFVSDIRAARSYFFANKDRPGYNDTYAYYQPKSPRAFRVLLAGGSAIKGYPQPRNLAPSAFLREQLQDLWPDREVEVLNIGTTAVASFPVMEMTLEALAYEPDLVVVYSGHNEFFGAYGVASIHRAGSRPGMLRFQRRVRSLALIQGLDEILPSRADDGRALMEIMVGQSYTPPLHWSRDAAARNLHHHLGRIVDACRSQGVPVVLCTLPGNERDLAPIGESRFASAPSARRPELARLLEQAEPLVDHDPAAAEPLLREILADEPHHALAHYRLGQALFRLERFEEAHTHFVLTRDFDTMPWRAPSTSQDAIRRAAEEGGALLCDVESVFRAASPGGSIGWELMDDHVHPSLQGQHLIAQAIVERLTDAEGILHVDRAALDRLPGGPTYASRLGANPYDAYGVDHQLRVLFNVPFLRASNPDGLARFDARAKAFEVTLGKDLLEIARNWQSHKPHAGGRRPITGMMARGLMRRGDMAGALPLLEIAQRSVPEYSSWHMEYVYFELACREQLQAGLRPEDRQRALDEIERGKLLLSRGYSESGLAERYVGRLHQLRGEFAEAIPYLLAGRPKLHGFDVVATDQALFLSYLRTGQTEEARLLVENGIRHSGPYAEHYARMQGQIPGAERARTEGEWFH